MRRILTTAATLACLIAVPTGAAGDSRVYAPLDWQGNGRSVQVPPRFVVEYQAQSLTMKNVKWQGWGSRLATGHGLSFYNSNQPGQNVTLYMGGGTTTCPNGKRYYKLLAATGPVTSYFPVQPLSPWFGEKSKPRKALGWYLLCTGGGNATTGYWSRLR
jgi:hypothetical protein